ncbi:MAG TPA: efflux transporter outer membrane subunit [Polyangia bacterium]
MIARSLSAILCLGLGCAGTPDKPAPVTAHVPGAWRAEGESTAELPPLQPGTIEGGTWWRTFDDPALDRLMAEAQTRNLDLRIMEARIREARAIQRAAGRNLLPEINGAAGIETGRTRAGVSDADTTAQASLGVSWELDLFGRLRNEARAAAADAEATLAERDGLRAALLADVARAYFQDRRYRAEEALARKNIEAQASTVRITRARFEQGVASRLDLERTTAQLAVTRSRLPLAVELADSARAQLALLLASTPEEIARFLPGEAPLPRTDVTAVLRAPGDVIAARPDVRSAERRLQAAVARRAATGALRFPRLSLAGLVGVRTGDEGALFESQTGLWSVGANLLTPIFHFGRIRAAIDAADARQEQAYLEYERVARSALSETQTAIVSYRQGALRQRELGVAVEAGRKAVDLARRQYAEGTLSLLEVLDAERTVYDAELSWSQASIEVALRLVRLYQTMGVVPPVPPTTTATQTPAGTRWSSRKRS